MSNEENTAASSPACDPQDDRSVTTPDGALQGPGPDANPNPAASSPNTSELHVEVVVPKPSRLKKAVAYVSLALSQVAFAVYTLLIKKYATGNNVDPVLITGFRVLTGLLVFPVFAYLTEGRFSLVPAKGSYLFFAFFSITYTCLNPLLYIVTIYLSSGSYSALLTQFLPIFVTVICWILKTEEFPSFARPHTFIKPAGILILVAGSLYISVTYFMNGLSTDVENSATTTATKSISTKNFVLSTVVGTLNTLSIAAFYVYQERYFFRNPSSVYRNKPSTINALLVLYGSALFLIGSVVYFCVKEGPFIGSLNAPVIILIVYASVINGCVIRLVNSWCTKVISSLILGVSFSFQFLCIIILLSVFADEVLYTSQYVACGFVVVGIILVISGKKLYEQIVSEKDNNNNNNKNNKKNNKTNQL